MASLLDSFNWWLVAVSLLGIGTALVYPTLLAAISDAVSPGERATFLGVYRFWRDAGAIAGALAAGTLADLFGFAAAIQSVAVLTVGSGLLAAFTVAGRKNVNCYKEPT
jgi:MFS family permease